MNNVGRADIRLVAIDLDGTLLDASKRVCARAAPSLCELSAAGVTVVIASARPPRSVRHIFRELKLDTWQINYNGAMIWDEPRQAIVFHEPLDGVLVAELIRWARTRFANLLIACEIKDRWFTDCFDPAYTTETGRLFKPDVIAPVEEFCNQPITKLMFLGEPPVMSSLQEALHAGGRISITRSDPDLLQIMHPAVSKATALRIVADHYGVQMSNILAIGDAHNDIPMLETAGYSVAMGNAAPPVKAAADWIAPANTKFGVHEALRHFGLVD